MILPSLTMTAPNGPPHPFSTDSMASRVASWANCFLYSSLSMSVLLIALLYLVGVVSGKVGRFPGGVGRRGTILTSVKKHEEAGRKVKGEISRALARGCKSRNFFIDPGMVR